MQFDFSFPKSYEIALLEELPGVPQLQIYYPSGKEHGSNGTPFKITNKNKESWIGIFASETSNGLCSVNSCPNPDKLLVTAGGLSSYIDTINFREPSPLDYMYVNQVVTCVPAEKLLLVGWLDIVCIGTTGVLWESRLEYEITKIRIENGIIFADGLAAGTEEPWNMKASLTDGKIL